MIGRKIAILGMVLLMGLSFAPNGVPEYIMNQYERTECMYNVASWWAFDVDNEFDGGPDGNPGAVLLGRISDSIDDMEDAIDAGSWHDALAEYANIVSLFSQMRILWFQYGISHVLGGGGTMADLVEILTSDYSKLLTCFVEGPNGMGP